MDGITRRYPEIVILKPFNACPQICVYCQRNWEIKSIDDEVQMSREKIQEAIAWIGAHDSITEVLVTGGDPLTLKNDYLDALIGEIAKINHVERIRIGTRVPVTLPFRINEGFLQVLEKYHEWGKREIAMVTHFEHPTEMKADALDAIKKIKKLGIKVYNQQVFTYYNSRKFETCLLRKVLKRSPVSIPITPSAPRARTKPSISGSPSPGSNRSGRKRRGCCRAWSGRMNPYSTSPAWESPS